jgi:hypothetical protein
VHKKVIAQQVEKVLPVAVKNGTNFLPDIYIVAGNVEAANGRYFITLPKGHHLVDGDKVRLILEKGTELYLDVKVVDDTTFSVEADKPIGTKVFVYGKQRNDVRIVDYDGIAILNVSATQELAKKSDQQKEKIVEQDARIETLEAQISLLKGQAAELTKLSAKFEALEKHTAMSPAEAAGGRTVALNH